MLHRLLTVILLLLGTQSVWAGADPSQRLQSIRSNGFLLASNLLVFYNYRDAAAAFAPEAREAYRANLAELQREVGALPGEPQLGQALRDVEDAIVQLEKQPEDPRGHYPRWLNAVLRAHGELEKHAAALYTTANPDAGLAALNAQSVDIGRLLLLYETQAFSGLGIFIGDFHDGSLVELDARVAQRHTTLLEQQPDSAALLGRVWTDYQFVRPGLLDPARGVASRSASRYLGKSMGRLDQLASTAR